jgi:hypothetical protein
MMAKEEFLERWPASDGVGLGQALLAPAALDRDADGVEYALIVCFSFGFTDELLPNLVQLAFADWHQCHGDVVSALDDLRSTAAWPRSPTALLSVCVTSITPTRPRSPRKPCTGLSTWEPVRQGTSWKSR